jgi:hypothetical protein
MKMMAKSKRSQAVSTSEPAQVGTKFTPAQVEEMRALATRIIESGDIVDRPPEFTSEDEQWEFGRRLALQGQEIVDHGNQHIGLGLLLMHKTTRHGEWGHFVERELRKSRQWAHQQMKVAQFLLSLPEEYRRQALASPDSNVNRGLHLSFRRARDLARLGKETISQLVDDGQLEDLATMPDREFSALIQERKAREYAERQLEKYQDEYRQDLHRKKIKETVLQGIPDAIQQARRFAALVGGMGMELSIRGQTIFDRSLAAEELHADPSIRATQFKQAAAAQLAGVDAAIKALLDLREHITEQASDVGAKDIPGLHAIEIDEALDNYRWMLDCHGARAEHIGVPAGRKVKAAKR